MPCFHRSIRQSVLLALGLLASLSFSKGYAQLVEELSAPPFEAPVTPAPSFIFPPKNADASKPAQNAKGTLAPYLESLDKSMLQHWHPPAINHFCWLTVRFEIDRNGNLSELKVDKNLNTPDTTVQATLQALQKAAPFEPLPSSVKGDNLSLEFVFSNAAQKNGEFQWTAHSAEQLNEVDFGPYVAKLQKKIRHNWQPPMSAHHCRLVALFHIDREGQLSQLTIQQNRNADEKAVNAAENAIRKSVPFDHLPTGFKGTSITVQFIFDYELKTPGQFSSASNNNPTKSILPKNRLGAFMYKLFEI